MHAMRFLFTTLQYVESDFYGRVGEGLEERGHEVVHVTWSRRAARQLRRGGEAHCVPDLIAALAPFDAEVEARRIVDVYGLPSLRDVWRTDWPCADKPERWCVERTVGHFLALEGLFDRVAPDVVVPEVGSETLRTAAHRVALARGVPVLFLLYTIFPRPLRLYVDTFDAQIVQPDELRRLTDQEQCEVEGFTRDFKRRATPIRPYRERPIRPRGAKPFFRHLAVRAIWDRDNDYLRPALWLRRQLAEHGRAALARRLYQPLRRRPYVYFPLHVTDDYKIARVVPHCADQASIVELLAGFLPHGHDLVVKEHPMSIGRNRIGLLRRLRRIGNVRLVEPRTSSHELIEGADGVAVIGSTVGLEALLYEKPVLTLGRPFYSGAGVTYDVDDFRELPAAVPALLGFRPDPERVTRFLGAAMRRCYAGAPVLVDRSDENASAVAESLVSVALRELRERSLQAGPKRVTAVPD
jgi:Capsule polysaccharide biosynthesis protein